MPKIARTLIMAATIGLVALATQLVWAQQASTALQRKSPDAAALAARAAQGPVRIIVQYIPSSGPAHAAMGTQAENIAGIVRENHAAQDPILATHFGPLATLEGPNRALRRMDITSAFAINASAAEIEALANDDRVVTIQIDGVNKLNLIQSVPLIGMDSAYSSYGATGSNWAIAVLDTGVASSHEFITGKVISEACYSTTSGIMGAGGSTSMCPGGVSSSTASGSGVNCNITWSGCEHGTHVAGIAAGNNTSYSSGEPTNGVAKGASIIAIQVFSEFSGFDCSPSPSPCVAAWDSDILSGINQVYAIRSSTGLSGGVASINLSLGGSSSYTSNCDSSYPTLKSAIDNLLSAGIATVIAAGNSRYTNKISYPACISSAIAVASSDKNDLISSFTNINSQVAVFAPGGVATGGSGDILSSVPSGYICTSPAFGYCYLAGTSMATPHVTGAFAAIRSVVGSGPSVATILNALVSSGKSITDNRSGGTIIKPRIQVDQALSYLTNTSALTVTGNPALLLIFGNFSLSNPSIGAYTLSNTGSSSLTFTVTTPSWLVPVPSGGTLAPGASTNVSIDISPNFLVAGPGKNLSSSVTFTNTSNNVGTRSILVTLLVAGGDSQNLSDAFASPAPP